MTSLSRLLNHLLSVTLLVTILHPGHTQSATDELVLRNGQRVTGTFLRGDQSTIVFGVGDDIQTHPSGDVSAVFFGTKSAESPDIWPPGFSAVLPVKLAHLIVLRRITANHPSENGEYEPEIAKISGDGSTIAIYAPKSGIHILKADGSQRRLLVPNDNTPRTQCAWDRFELNRTGTVLFWQGGGTIYRIDTDGSNERILVRSGAEYEAFRLREDCKRLFYSQRGGIFSVDIEGRGEPREIITHRRLSQVWGASEDHCLLGRFDVTADGTRIAFVVGGYPNARNAQLMALMSDGSGLRRIADTEFDPWALTMKPDGSQVIGWQYGVKAVLFNWDGSTPADLPLPPWDANGSGFQHLNRFSADGRFFAYNGNESGGFGQLSRADGSQRYEPQNTGRWDYYDNALFHGMYSPVYSDNLRRFVTISQYWRGFRPRQLVVGDINPRTAQGVPVLSDITLPTFVSTNPQAPAHRGRLTVRIRRATSDIGRVQYMLIPACMKRPKDGDRWVASAGWDALQGDHRLYDDGTHGDTQAGDGVYTTDNFAPDAGDGRPHPGRYLVRIVAHDDQSAVIVDVDGVMIAPEPLSDPGLR